MINGSDVMNSSSMKTIDDTPGLAFELLKLTLGWESYRGRRRNKGVDYLRRELHERGLSIDGTRSMLVERLELNK